MSNISYTYEIVSVNEAARCMEIVYQSPGRSTQHIGARLPYVGESLETIVQMYAPIAYWREQEAMVQSVAVGTKGSVSDDPQTLEGAKAKKKDDLAAKRYVFECSSVTVNGLSISTSRDSQAVIASTQAAMQSGALQSVQWKTTDGSFATLDSAGFAAVSQAVTAHVQSAFSLEKQLVDQVNAATTIQAVEAVQWPN